MSEPETQDIKWLKIRYEASLSRVVTAAEAVRDLGVEPILIKGWAVARRYPRPYERMFSDIDLCVDPQEYERVIAALREQDLGAPVDLHAGLRHLDFRSWESLFERSTLAELNGNLIRVLSSEDHLRVLATHWLNDGGAKAERLDDLYHTVKGAQPAFNWEACLVGVPDHRRTWIAAAVAACSRYRNHAFGNLPFDESELRLPGWFSAALEKEWASEPLEPLYYLRGSPRRFLSQLSRRFPPNPIQATIEMEAPIDQSSRISLQLRSFLRRIPQGIRMQLRNFGKVKG